MKRWFAFSRVRMFAKGRDVGLFWINWFEKILTESTYSFSENYIIFREKIGNIQTISIWLYHIDIVNDLVQIFYKG